MPYRSMAATESRLLVVPNHPTVTALVAACTGLGFALVGFGLFPALQAGFYPPGTEVVMSAMATVFLLAGVALAGVGIRMKRSRTILALDRDELTITVGSGGRSVCSHVLHIQDIAHVGLEGDHDRSGATYRTQIVLHSGDTIPLGDASTAARGHYERVAEKIRDFLSGG